MRKSIIFMVILAMLALMIPSLLPEAAAAQPAVVAPMALSDADEAAIAAAVVTLREKLVLRETNIEIPMHLESTDQADLSGLLKRIYEAATVHTGVPTEGDYIQYHLRKVEMNMSASIGGNGMDLVLSYVVTYNVDAQQEAEMDAAVDALLAQLDLWEASDYDKIRGIYDYICENVVYDYDNLEDQEYLLKYSAYAALVQKKAVCQGYASLFYRLALELGLDCRMISGIGNGGAHAWNIVKLDGMYYYLDATWDSGRTAYAYFLRGSESFLADHTLDPQFQDAAFTGQYPISATDYVVPVEHHYEAVVTQPTCTEAGYTTYTCSHCGDSYVTEEVEALGHDYQSAVVAPNCTENGYTEHTCSRCNDSYRTDVVDATGHSWDEGMVTKDPTDVEVGEITYTCINCGETRVEEIPMLEHTHAYIAMVTEPTCELQGYTTYTCSCGDSYVEGYTDALGHDYETLVTLPTCTEDGYTTYTCTRCGDSHQGDTVPASGHDWGEGEVTKEPTEDSTGEMLVTCITCGYTETQTIPELGHEHNYVATVTPPTCTEQGYTTYTCTCGSYRADFVSPTGHTYEKTVTPPTCTQQGYTTHTCACGDTYVGNYIPAEGHRWDEGTVTKEPTERENGEKRVMCMACGETEIRTIPALGHTHNYVADVVEPGCISRGFTVYMCECGDCYETDEVAPLGHDYGENGRCLRCDEEDPNYNKDTINPTEGGPVWETKPSAPQTNPTQPNGNQQGGQQNRGEMLPVLIVGGLAFVAVMVVILQRKKKEKD